MIVIFVIGVAATVYMIKRTAGEGKHKSTNPEAGSRPNESGPNQADQ